MLMCVALDAIAVIYVYLDVCCLGRYRRVWLRGLFITRKNNVHIGGRFSPPNSTFSFFLDSAPNRRAWLRGLLITRKITLILCMWQVAVIFICVYLDVRVLICVFLDVRVAGRYRIYLRNPSNIYKLK